LLRTSFAVSPLADAILSARFRSKGERSVVVEATSDNRESSKTNDGRLVCQVPVEMDCRSCFRKHGKLKLNVKSLRENEDGE
jgi:hypothetical protein